MTMFNWQAAPDQPIMSPHLWVYFVVAVPLTLIVLVIWLWWFRRQEKQHKQDIEDVEMRFEDAFANKTK